MTGRYELYTFEIVSLLLARSYRQITYLQRSILLYLHVIISIFPKNILFKTQFRYSTYPTPKHIYDKRKLWAMIKIWFWFAREDNSFSLFFFRYIMYNPLITMICKLPLWNQRMNRKVYSSDGSSLKNTSHQPGISELEPLNQSKTLQYL